MSCVFCDIVNKVINARIIAENENAIAFLDVSPITDGHTLVITKEHYKNLSSTPNNVLNDVIALTKEVANKLYESELRPWGFNYVSNEGTIAGQVVMHFHIHVIPKYSKNEGFDTIINNKDTRNIEEVYKIIKKGK